MRFRQHYEDFQGFGTLGTQKSYPANRSCASDRAGFFPRQAYHDPDLAGAGALLDPTWVDRLVYMSAVKVTLCGRIRRASPVLGTTRSTDISPIKGVERGVERADTVTDGWRAARIAALRTSLNGVSIARLTTQAVNVSPLPHLRAKQVCLFDQFPIQTIYTGQTGERGARGRIRTKNSLLSGRLKGLFRVTDSNGKSLTQLPISISGSPAKRTSKRQL